MADGSGGVGGAVAEGVAKLGTSLFKGVVNEASESLKAAGNQLNVSVGQTNSQQSPQSAKQQQVINQQKQKEKTETPEKIADVQEELKKIQMANSPDGQKPSSPETNPQKQNVTDGNGKSSILAQRLFQDVQGKLAYKPQYWGEDALQEQKQEEAQNKQQEEQEAQMKKEEEEKKKLADAPIMPGGTQKGPVGPGAKKKAAPNIALQQAMTKGETGRGTKG